MSTAPTAIFLEVDEIANDALEFVRYGREHTTWLAALMRAIQLDTKYNKGRRVDELAKLGQYLADDCSNYLDLHAEKLQSSLSGAQEVVQ